MSNEELAVAIQAGDQSLIPQLWEQVQKFVAMQAGKYFRRETKDRGIVTGYDLEDLIQQSYFALLSAVDRFDPEKGGFLSILDLCLKSSFQDVAGYRTARQRNDGLAFSVSGDVPLGEDSDLTLLDTLPSQAPETEDAAIEGEYQQQLHEVLEKAMSNLSDKQNEILRRRYYRQETCIQIGADMGCTSQSVSDQEQAALRHLYNARSLNGLSQFLETHTNYYQKVGVREYKMTRSSSVEKIVLHRERLVERWLKGARKR